MKENEPLRSRPFIVPGLLVVWATLVLVGVVLWQGRVSWQQEEMTRQAAQPESWLLSPSAPAELRILETADPVRELRKALQRKDKRFIQAGFLTGVNGGHTNPVVAVAGTRFIEGTTDFIQYADQVRLTQKASEYAARYNRLLLNHLLLVNDPAVVQARRTIDRELTRLERRDPIQDARQTLRENAPGLMLLSLPNGRDDTPGVTDKVYEVIQQRVSEKTNNLQGVGFYPLPFDAQVMTPAQRRRAANLIVCYIAPHNHYISKTYIGP
jgi:hypothetical protein